jgi:hypothetical protein
MIDVEKAYQLGREARDRFSNSDCNPFPHCLRQGRAWLDGWIDRDFEFFKKSGLTKAEWARLMSVKLQ